MDPIDHKMMLLHLYAGYRAGEDRTCGKKVRYSEESAIRSAEAMNKKPTTRHEVEAYPCPFCNHWHLGGVWPVERMQALLEKEEKAEMSKESKCVNCVYYDKDGFVLNGYDQKIPDTCKTGSEYYCVVSGYSLFKDKDA